MEVGSAATAGAGSVGMPTTASDTAVRAAMTPVNTLDMGDPNVDGDWGCGRLKAFILAVELTVP
nr:hypothetical protein Ade03nite_24210 [Actinoplanes derwentensis]